MQRRVITPGWMRAAVLVLVLAAGGAVVIAVAPAASAATYLVSCPSGNLQSKIDAASPGSTISISGVCTGTFAINKDLTLVGGTLDGGGAGTVLSVSSGTVSLNNMTIRNGKSEGGGGISNFGNLTVNNTTVTGNTASSSANISASNTATCSAGPCDQVQGYVNVANAGGGIFNVGTLTLNSSTVSHNTATGDGTMTLTNSASCTAQCSVTQTGLHVGDAGGGIFNLQGAVTLNSSTVSGNSAAGHGVIDASNSTSCTVSCTVTQTWLTVGAAGGGIANVDGTVVMKGSTISGNSATSTASVSQNNSKSCVTDCTVYQTLTDMPGNGGGLANFGSGTGFGPATVTISASRIVSNTADLGAGILNAAAMSIDSSTISSNQARGAGGGVSNVTGATLKLAGSTVTKNSATSGGGVSNAGSFSQSASIISGNVPDNCEGC